MTFQGVERVMLILLLVLILVTPATYALEVRFIGNSGFEISDGSATILVDFPYQSGAYGYMTFDPVELGARPDSLCLFTHRHADHFDPEAIAGVGCAVLGPSEVMVRVEARVRLEGDGFWDFAGAQIECLETEHGEVDHCSWILRWDDRTIVIAGDVEHLDGVLPVLKAADVLIIPSWLASSAEKVRGRFPDARIVISHHRAGEDLSACADCLVPSPGSSHAW